MSTTQHGVSITPICRDEVVVVKDDESILNSPNCRVWTVIDEVNLHEITVTWSSIDIEPHRVITAKEYIRALFGKGTVTHGALYARSKTLKNYITYIKFLLNAVDALYGEEKRIAQLELAEVREVLVLLARKKDGGLWGSGKIKNIISLLSKLADLHEKGLVTDGIDCPLPSNLNQLALIKPYIESLGIDYHEWAKNGSWHNLSIDVALLVLEYHISIVESPLSKFLVDYFDFQRSEFRVDPDDFIQPGKFRDEFTRLLANNINSETSLQKLANLFTKHGFIQKGGALSEYYQPVHLYRPAQKIKDSAMFSFTALSGIRVSEVASVRYSNFDQKHGVWYFKSSLLKTNHGLPITRSVSQQAFKIIKTAAYISYLPLNSDVSPFAFTYGRSTYHDQEIKPRFNTRKEDLAKKVTSAYKQCVAENSDWFPECPESTSPHALRHIFAAISLKAFSGDVRNHIRRHFGHSPNSEFTKRYLDNKLGDAIVSATESDFFKNFVGSIGSDDPEFFAAIAKRIRQRVSEDHAFHSPEEFADYLAHEAIDTCEIVGHEFGYSVPWDKDDFECIADTHHLTGKSAPEDIVRIGISHQHLLDKCPNDKVREASKSIIAMCEKMLSELDIDLADLNYD